MSIVRLFFSGGLKEIGALWKVPFPSSPPQENISVSCAYYVQGSTWVQITYAMSHITFYFFPMSPCHFL